MMLGGKIESPVWGVFGFNRCLQVANCCRAIFECGLNKVFKDTLSYSLKTKHQIRNCCCNSGGFDDFVFLQFDFMSFYDQFVLEM